jgi:hypothetical protein
MCLARISKAIADTQTELKNAAMKAGHPKEFEKLLKDRLNAFDELQATVGKIKSSLYADCGDGSEDPCYPPHPPNGKTK